MDNVVAKQLKILNDEYGTRICNEPRRCRGLLLDLCGDYKKEIRVLQDAMELGVPQLLLSLDDIPYKFQRAKLVKGLIDEYAIADNAALWAVDAWAFALGIVDILPQTTSDSISKQNYGTKTENQYMPKENAKLVIDEVATERHAAEEKRPNNKSIQLDAHYVIGNEIGETSLGNLNIGAEVVDPSWMWEFRTGENYSGTGKTKPVIWIVVAKNHYGAGTGVTLLAKEHIGKYSFEHYWGMSGAANNSTYLLRTWLNSNGINKGEGFYNAFSDTFKAAIILTNIPNKSSNNDNAFYTTADRVFIPSTTELGDTIHWNAWPIGKPFPFFKVTEGQGKRELHNFMMNSYWTRSPGRRVSAGRCYRVNQELNNAVRPAVNLKSDTPVSKIGQFDFK